MGSYFWIIKIKLSSLNQKTVFSVLKLGKREQLPWENSAKKQIFGGMQLGSSKFYGLKWNRKENKKGSWATADGKRRYPQRTVQKSQIKNGKFWNRHLVLKLKIVPIKVCWALIILNKLRKDVAASQTELNFNKHIIKCCIVSFVTWKNNS